MIVGNRNERQRQEESGTGKEKGPEKGERGGKDLLAFSLRTRRMGNH